MSDRDPAERLIVALDLPTVDEARQVVDELSGLVRWFKIGHQLAFTGGLDLARELKRDGYDVFLDLKLLDISATVEKGVASLASIGIDMLTIHAYPQAMQAAVRGKGPASMTLLGVTVLTSLDDGDLQEAGYGIGAADLVALRTRQAAEAGMDGLVCSAAEAQAVRRIVGEEMAIVTPGIRLATDERGDQKRVTTPSAALGNGASHLVVGRPITAAANRRETARSILAEMGSALARG